MLKRTTVLSALICLIFTGIAFSANVKIKVISPAHGPFPNVLVIVKSLEGRGEMLRTLSDSKGEVETALPNGTSQLIATCPFGIGLTKIKEFVISRDPEQIPIMVGVMGTVSEIFIGSASGKLILIDKRSQPLTDCMVLIRNWDASKEQRYKPNKKGVIHFDIVDNPLVLILFNDSQLVSKVLHFQCDKFDGLAKSLTCWK